MNKKLPLITITVATYRSRRTIEKCLISLKNQTYPNIEISVVDSLFYDKTEQKKCQRIIEKYAKYFQDGPERSIQRNRGIKEANGTYILIVDQDMYFSPTVVEECYRTLVKSKYIALTIPEISIGQGYWTKCVALDRYITTNLEKGMNECCRFFRKKDARAIGGYDPTIVGVEDSDFHYRMLEKGSIGKIKSIIYHDEGKTSFWGRVRKKYYYSIAFKAYLKRRPKIAVSQFSPFKIAYLKQWKYLMKKPHLTIGIIALRTAEVSAGLIGMLRR